MIRGHLEAKAARLQLQRLVPGGSNAKRLGITMLVLFLGSYLGLARRHEMLLRIHWFIYSHDLAEVIYFGSQPPSRAIVNHGSELFSSHDGSISPFARLS